MDDFEALFLGKMNDKGFVPAQKTDEGRKLPKHWASKPMQTSNLLPFDARRSYSFTTQLLGYSSIARLHVIGSSPKITKGDWQLCHGIEFGGDTPQGAEARAYRIYDGRAYLYVSERQTGTTGLELLTTGLLTLITALSTERQEVEDLPWENPLAAMDAIVELYARYSGRDQVN